jgi:acetylornithine deacetylase/succinyl-diaminopimelate desuccinylase-like protein
MRSTSSPSFRSPHRRTSRASEGALVAALFAAALLAAPTFARAQAEPNFDEAAASVRTLLGELVAADTSNPPGNEARAVGIGAGRLAAAKIPYRVTEFAPDRQNLVARLHGDGSERPLLLLAHVDVVGAGGQSWSTDPHTMTEQDGFLVGRGTNDDLGMAATALEVFVLLHRSGIALKRDVILAWTGDEESGGGGVRWLLEHEPDSVDAEIALNEGGGPVLGEDGRVKLVDLQTAEKFYQDYSIVAHGPTGHSSVPLPGNAIYRLAHGLDKLQRFQFPARLLPVTRAWLAARAPLEKPELGAAMKALAEAKGPPPEGALHTVDADPALSAELRTTCVATQILGGTRANALPAEARANVNCRILPDESATDVARTLGRVVGDPGLEIVPTDEFGHAEPSPLDGAAAAAIRKVSAELWPGAPVVPFLSKGATDSRFLRAHGVRAYGLGPIAMTEEDARRAHGVDERIPAASLRPGVEFLYRLVVELAAQSPP